MEIQVLEYIWIGGKGEIRSKTKVLTNYEICNVDNFPEWNYDGSSTWQADSNKNTEVILKPCAIFKDPLRNIKNANCFLILCDTYDEFDNPLKSNTRFLAKEIFDKNLLEYPWFGLEQEYYIITDSTTNSNKNAIEGYHYCGFTNISTERKIVEEHLDACINAGLTISGINAEVVEGQWEYQIGPCVGIDSGDQIIISRYLLSKIAEKYNSIIDYQPKPYSNKNGSGCHNNFSTEKTRNKNGIEYIYKYMSKLEKKHKQHLAVYGEENEKRLTGIHETSSYEQFSWGVGTRNTSVRIPNQVVKDGHGYFEDRRPASNIDPYLTTSMLFNTCCID